MALNEKIKNLLSLALRIGLSGALMAYLFSKIDTAKMLTLIKSADMRYLGFSAFAFISINGILLVRWIIFIRALGLKVSVASVTNCFFIGLFFNLFLPSSTGGDVVKTIGLFRDTADKAKGVASVVADRLCGFVSIVLIASVSFCFGYRFVNDNSILIFIAILAFVSGGLVLVLFNEKLFSLMCRVFDKFPRIKESFLRLHFAIALLKNKPKALLAAVGCSSLSQGILACIFFLIAKGLHQEIPLIYFLIFIPLVCVISSLPSIGGLGVREGGAAFLFAKVGVETSIIVSISLMSFLFMVLTGLIGGLVYIFALSYKGKAENALKANPQGA